MAKRKISEINDQESDLVEEIFKQNKEIISLQNELLKLFKKQKEKQKVFITICAYSY